MQILCVWSKFMVINSCQFGFGREGIFDYRVVIDYVVRIFYKDNYGSYGDRDGGYVWVR